MAILIDNDALDIGELASGYGQPGLVQNASIAAAFSAQVNTTGNLEVYKSDDDGASWTLDTTFNDDPNIKMFSFATSPRGDIFISFSFPITTLPYYTIKVKKRDYITGTWSEVLSKIYKPSTNYPLKPLLTWNRYESNRLHLFWMEKGDGGNGAVYNVYTDNYGSTWNSEWTNGKVLYFGTENYYTMDSIDTSPLDGKVYIYHRLVESASILYEYEYSSTGVYTASTQLPSATTRLHRGSSTVIDSNNNKWVLVYYKYNAVNNYRLEIIDRGGSYSSTFISVDSGSAPIYSGMLSMAIDILDNIYVFYTKISDDKCYYRKFNVITASWESENVLTTGEGLRPACIQHQASGSRKIISTFYTN